jgi:hypothetical protein
MTSMSKRILVSWYTDPRYIAPFTLSDTQVTVGPKLNIFRTDHSMYAATTPVGSYDLKAVLRSQGIGTNFDLIVVFADASQTNMPLNLEAFPCPKVLCVGDTHHLQEPLQKMIRYARAGGFNFIISIHNRHHLHWFVHAGFPNVAWIPALAAQHTPRSFSNSRQAQICFVGQAAELHPRRVRLLQALRYAGMPVITMHANRRETADLYSSSVVSFNASLNGDLNLRVFEVLSAGGCLLTDRLAPHAGLDLLLEENKEFVAYDSAEELLEKARLLLQNPRLALDIAEAGNRAYTSSFLPGMQNEALLKWVFAGKLKEEFHAIGDRRCLEPVSRVDLESRLRVYETLQQLHWEKETPRVLFASDVAEIYLSDAADLKRLNPKIATAPPTLDAGSERVERLCDASETGATAWDCILIPAGRNPPNGLRYARWLPV